MGVMIMTKPPLNPWCLSTAAILTSCLAAVSPVQAELTETTQAAAHRSLSFIEPSLEMRQGSFEDTGRPIHRTAGGTRGPGQRPCQIELVAVVPLEVDATDKQLEETNNPCSLEITSPTTFTSLERPVLWFYIPIELDAGTKATLTLLNADLAEPQSSTTVSLSVTPGFVSVPLTHRLEVDQPYRWNFTVATPSASDLTVTGVTQRITPSSALTQQLRSATPSSQAELYARAGLWQDALTTLGNLRRTDPTNPAIAADWATLLSSVGLGEIANAPLLECCTPEPSTTPSNF